MQNLETLATLASELPATVLSNATRLVQEMGTTVDGIGDDPVEWRPSFLRLVQGTTDRGSIPKGTAIGDFVLGEEKIEQPLKFIPIRIWDGRQCWDPDQTNNKMICWSPDAKLGSVYGDCRTCEKAQWVEGEGAACSKLKTAMVIDSTLSKVFTINFAKSNYKIGMELEGLMKKASSFPYTRVYGLTSTTSSTAKNVEIFKIEVLDDKLRRTQEEFLPFLKELFGRVSTDRKTMLDQFYESAKARQATQAQLTGNAAVAAIEAPVEGTKTLEVTKDASAVSNLAKGYQV